VLLLGATGSIGRATLQALQARGHAVLCLARRPAPAGLPANVAWRQLAHLDEPAVAAALASWGPVDALVSCLASRTGVPAEAWAIDHAAHLQVLQAARAAGAGQMVLLSALCVQKPRLAFQHAKLAFEQALRESGLVWSIVRPTAYFKSLSGQVQRVRQGRPYLVFADGRLTACKPIGDEDLADYLAGCLDEPVRHNRILPIGGPGPALTPRQQGEDLFALLGRPPRFKQVPLGLLRGIAGGLGRAARLLPAWHGLAVKAELARIGLYYASESMLVWDADAGRYDADATPEHGSQTLRQHHARMLRGEVGDDRGEHAVF
jgi:divinyl chlorophyllide a 8-vinyl-reductase